MPCGYLTLDDLQAVAAAHLVRGERFVWRRVVDSVRTTLGRSGMNGIGGVRRQPAQFDLELLEVAEHPPPPAWETADAWRWVCRHFKGEDLRVIRHLAAGGQARAIAAAMGVTESAVCHRRRRLEATLRSLMSRAGFTLPP